MLCEETRRFASSMYSISVPKCCRREIPSNGYTGKAPKRLTVKDTKVQVQILIHLFKCASSNMLQVPRCKLSVLTTMFSVQLKTECAFRTMVSLGRSLRHPIRMSASHLITHCLGPDMLSPNLRLSGASMSGLSIQVNAMFKQLCQLMQTYLNFNHRDCNILTRNKEEFKFQTYHIISHFSRPFRIDTQIGSKITVKFYRQ